MAHARRTEASPALRFDQSGGLGFAVIVARSSSAFRSCWRTRALQWAPHGRCVAQRRCSRRPHARQVSGAPRTCKAGPDSTESSTTIASSSAARPGYGRAGETQRSTRRSHPGPPTQTLSPRWHRAPLIGPATVGISGTSALAIEDDPIRTAPANIAQLIQDNRDGDVIRHDDESATCSSLGVHANGVVRRGMDPYMSAEGYVIFAPDAADSCIEAACEYHTIQTSARWSPRFMMFKPQNVKAND